MVDRAMTKDNPFQRFWDLGYKRLCPIIPPDAELDPKSKVAERMAKDPEKDARGKAPGVPGPHGWIGYDFVRNESTEFSVEKWFNDGANVGIKTGDGIIAVDIDVTNEKVASATVALAEKMLGRALVRYGRYPKALLVYRTTDDVPYDKVTFSTETEDHALVEVLSEGRQFVAHGKHPKTGKAYSWPDGVPSVESLTTVSPEQLSSFLTRIEDRMPASKRFTGSVVDRSEVSQSGLRGSDEVILDALNHLPNTDGLFPTRDDYLKVGYAIKAALGPENDARAFEAFYQWCGRWDGGANDFAEVESDWARMKPPFSVGAPYIYQLAELHGGWKGRVREFFEPLDVFEPDEDDPFMARPAEGEDDFKVEPITAQQLNFDDLEDIPPREWLYGTKISRGYATLLSSPGGVGKSSLANTIAVACAAGEELLSDKPIHQLRVMIYNLEDDLLEMKRRVKAVFMHFGLGPEVAANIFMLSGRDRRFNMLTMSSNGDMLVTPDYTAIKEEMSHKGVDLLVCDPLARAHTVPENDTSAQDEVMRLFAQIAHETGAGVLLLHHFNKGGVSGDMNAVRGSTALSAGARSILTLAPMSEEEAEQHNVPIPHRRHYVRIDDAKNNMAPARAAEWIQLHSIELGNGTELYPEGDNVQCAAHFDINEQLTDDAEIRAVAFARIKEAAAETEHYAPVRKGRAKWLGALLMELYPDCSIAQATGLINSWKLKGWVEIVTYRNKAGKDRKGVIVNSVATTSAALAPDPAAQQFFNDISGEGTPPADSKPTASLFD